MMFKKKLQKIREGLGKPTKLSEIEKERIKKMFKEIHRLLDDTEKAVLAMDRDDAYRYIDLLTAGLEQVDAYFVGGAEPQKLEDKPPEVLPRPREEATRIEARASKRPPPISAEQFQAMLDGLSTEGRSKAEQYLGCVKDFHKPEIGASIICKECSPERLMECIRAEDPTVKEDPLSLKREIEEEESRKRASEVVP